MYLLHMTLLNSHSDGYEKVDTARHSSFLYCVFLILFYFIFFIIVDFKEYIRKNFKGYNRGFFENNFQISNQNMVPKQQFKGPIIRNLNVSFQQNTRLFLSSLMFFFF